MKKHNTWQTAKNSGWERTVVGLVRPLVRCPVTFKYGIKAQTAATYLNLPSQPPLPPLPNRIDIKRERAGKGLSQQVRPRVGSDPLSE